MTPDKTRIGQLIALILCLIVLCGICPANGVMDPQPPHIFYGNVTIVGVGAPVHTTITAMVDGGSGILVTDTAGKYGGPGALSPKLLVQGEIPDASEIEFFVNGMPAKCREHGSPAWESSYPFTSGGVTNLDLNVEEIPLLADFSGNPTGGYVPLTVQFTDLSNGYHDEWSWDFGDGKTSSGSNPVHMFQNPGTYTVTLIISDTGAGISAEKTKPGYITVSAIPPAPVAAFTANQTTGIAPLAVYFTDLSSGSPFEWGWSFGDGATSALQNPVHVYTSPGTYTVALTVRGISGRDSEIKVNYITVLASPPAANFTANRTEGKNPLPVAFTDLSTGFPESWVWQFGDGSTSTAKNPVHTYSDAGIFTVNLTVSNNEGTDTLNRTDYINVSPSLSPTSSFTGTPLAGYDPLPVMFTDMSSGTITTWQWAFGDGTTSTEQNPNHTYKKGHYSVSLTVSNETGSDTLTKSDYITVYPRGSPGGGGGGGGGGSIGGTFFLSGGNATQNVTPTPTQTQPPAGTLTLGPDNRTTQQVTIVSSDGIASLTIGMGVTPVDSAGQPLRQVLLNTLPAGNLPPGSPCISTPYAYEIVPSGSTFSPPVSLKLTFDEATWAMVNGESASIIWYNPLSGSWEDIPTPSDPATRTISAKIIKGGIYALCTKALPTTTPITSLPAATLPSPGSSGIPMAIVIPAIILIVVIIAVIVYLISTRTYREGPPPEGGQ
jgi:PKD repeat protein